MVIRCFHPRHNGQWPPTSKNFCPRFYPLHDAVLYLLGPPALEASTLPLGYRRGGKRLFECWYLLFAQSLIALKVILKFATLGTKCKISSVHLLPAIIYIYIYYIPIYVLLKIQAVPSSGIQTSELHFPYHHSVIFRIRIMPVWRVNFINMPNICRTTFCTKEDKRVDTLN